MVCYGGNRTLIYSVLQNAFIENLRVELQNTLTSKIWGKVNITSSHSTSFYLGPSQPSM